MKFFVLSSGNAVAIASAVIAVGAILPAGAASRAQQGLASGVIAEHAV